MRQDGRDDFQAWLWGEILLFGLLGSSLALFVTNHELQTRFSLPQLGLVLQTIMAFAAGIIALLAGIRFSVEGRRLDLFLCTGFLVSCVSSASFSIAPLVGGHPAHRPEAWAGVVGRLLAWTLIAVAPFVRGRSGAPRPRQYRCRGLPDADLVLVRAALFGRRTAGHRPAGRDHPGC